MVIETVFSFCGWAVFGTSWTGVKSGCKRLFQIGGILTVCVVRGPLCMVGALAKCLHTGGYVDGRGLDSSTYSEAGPIFFCGQRFVGLAPEAAEVEFIGPATGSVPETAALRGFNRSREAPKLVVVKRDGKVAVFNVGQEEQPIRTHYGLYLPVEPESVRGDKGRLRVSDRVHLCRNLACTEEGGEHFHGYGVVKKFNPERFQAAQAHHGAIQVGRTVWSWLYHSSVVGKVKEHASESEAEDIMGCMAGNIRWNGGEGVVCLSNSRCTAVGSRFHQVLHEDVLADF